MELKGLISIEALQNIQDQFSTATGLAAITVDENGKYITKPSNFNDFCIKYTRGTEEGARRCEKCDSTCKGVYYCHAGLIDFSTDIVLDGKKIATIVGGQVLSKEPDLEKFRKIAKELGIDENVYIEAVKKVPVRPEKSIHAAASLLTEIITKVVGLEYIKKANENKLSSLNEEVTITNEAVREINARTKQLEGIASKQRILAINASIEASHAGELGVGFSVVAHEMRKLSEQSNEIYKEIKDCTTKIDQYVSKMTSNFMC